MLDAPIGESYRGTEQRTLTVFDVRIPGTAERLHRERAAWAGSGDIEALDQNHYVLIARPGGAMAGTEEGGAHGE